MKKKKFKIKLKGNNQTDALNNPNSLKSNTLSPGWFNFSHHLSPREQQLFNEWSQQYYNSGGFGGNGLSGAQVSQQQSAQPTSAQTERRHNLNPTTDNE